MAKPYRHPNKRIQHRTTGGRFRDTTLADIDPELAKQVCYRDRICVCGKRWRPIFAGGKCPDCGKIESVYAPLSEEELTKLKQHRSYPMLIDPRARATLMERQRLWEWLNRRGVFQYVRENPEQDLAQ